MALKASRSHFGPRVSGLDLGSTDRGRCVYGGSVGRFRRRCSGAGNDAIRNDILAEFIECVLQPLRAAVQWF